MSAAFLDPMRYIPLPEVAIDGVVTHPRPFEYTSFTITPLSNGQHDTEIVFHPGEQRFKLVHTEQKYVDGDSPHDRHDQMIIAVEPFEEDRPRCEAEVEFGHRNPGPRYQCERKDGHTKRDGTWHLGHYKNGKPVTWHG